MILFQCIMLMKQNFIATNNPALSYSFKFADFNWRQDTQRYDIQHKTKVIATLSITLKYS
jgi:hypothetical protein